MKSLKRKKKCIIKGMMIRWELF